MYTLLYFYTVHCTIHQIVHSTVHSTVNFTVISTVHSNVHFTVHSSVNSFVIHCTIHHIIHSTYAILYTLLYTLIDSILEYSPLSTLRGMESLSGSVLIFTQFYWTLALNDFLLQWVLITGGSPFRTPTMTLSTARLPDYDLHIDTQINVRYVFLQYSPTLLVDKTKWKIGNAEHYQNLYNCTLYFTL